MGTYFQFKCWIEASGGLKDLNNRTFITYSCLYTLALRNKKNPGWSLYLALMNVEEL